MQTRIIPKPKEKNEVLDVLKVVGLVVHEDESRIILQFDNKVSLNRLAKRYPEFGSLIFGNLERSCSKRGKK